MSIACRLGFAVLVLSLVPIAGARADQSWSSWSWGHAGQAGIGVSLGGGSALPAGGYLLPLRLEHADDFSVSDVSMGSDLVRKGIVQPDASGRWQPGAMLCSEGQCRLYAPGQASAMFGMETLVREGDRRHEVRHAFEKHPEQRAHRDHTGH